MTVKVQMVNGGSDSIDFVNATGTTLAQVKGYDDGSSNGHLELYTTASGTSTERVRVDSSGNVGIGTSSPNAKTEVNSSTAGGEVSRFEGAYSASGTVALSNWRRNGGAVAAVMRYNDANTDMEFGTTTSHAQAFITGGSERMRIDSSGNLLVGTTSTSVASGGCAIQPAGGESYINIGHKSGTSSGAYFLPFSYNGTIIGGVTQNGTTGVLYNLTSDYRLKNDPQPLTGAKEFVMALQPKKWQWWDGSGEGVGFIAHEFMEVAKYSGHGEKDAVDENGNPVYQSIQPSSSEVMANLVSFIQEQQAIIQTLTERITALENKQ